MDMDLLESGHEYKELPMSYVIFVCDFDPFKNGKYCYTFENRCLEDFSLEMGDGSRSIFLSTDGKDTDKTSKELRAFLEFIKTDNPENNTKTEDEYVKGLQQTIRRIKKNRELEREFMTWDDIRRDAKLEGRIEGITEGRLEGKREIILKFLKDLGTIPSHLKERIISEEEHSVLDSMSKAAATATSFSDFEEKISKL